MADETQILSVAQGRLLVSIVVIGRNEGDRLRRCLEAIAMIERRDFETEVIYVDSGSTDESVGLAQSYGARTIALQPERPSAALGRNAGWRMAKGAIILFLDGDTVLHPQFVADSLPEFSSETIGVVWGHRRELYPGSSIYNRVLDLDWIYAPGPTLFCGGDALFRRRVLEEVDGFDATLVAGEEPELCRRIAAKGSTILHVDRSMTGHDLAMTRWSQYWKRCTRAGHAFAEVSGRFRGTGQPFWEEDVRRNRNRFFILLGLIGTGVLASLLLLSVLPFLLVCAVFLMLGLRTAWKARWKSTDKVALVLYGFHSLLQQIPIYLGQLQYQKSRRKGQRRALFEYK